MGEGEGFPFYYVAGADRKGAVKAEWDDSALLQILTDIETDPGQKYLKCTSSNTHRHGDRPGPKVS